MWEGKRGWGRWGFRTLDGSVGEGKVVIVTSSSPGRKVGYSAFNVEVTMWFIDKLMIICVLCIVHIIAS